MHRFLEELRQLAQRDCTGRFRGRSGFGRFGGLAGGRGWGAGSFGRGRKLGAADLQLLILALLAEKPRHGYEIIKALDERSGGFYSPSPGMVYPALTYLDEIGHATVAAEGTKKLYRITADGEAHLAAHRATVDAILAQLAWIGGRMESVRRALSGDEGTADDAAADHGGRRHRVAPEVHAARRRLKAALIRKLGASPDEQRRVARVLERAADEILGKPDGQAA